VFAFNFNGKSLPSSSYEIYACGLPKDMAPPTYVMSTQTSITIQWTPPSFDGGCTIFDFSVLRDKDGTGTVWTEVNPMGSFPRDDPHVTTFTCETFPATVNTGDIFLFKIVAFNIQGSVTSLPSSPMYLASVPDAPSNAPTSDSSVTTGYYMKVVYSPVLGDGGMPVLSYELQIGSLSLNDFISVAGGDPYTLQLSFVVTTNITKGELYTFRYRAINQVGSGAWSPIAILQAATVPAPPG
jgi:hypothetical protein